MISDAISEAQPGGPVHTFTYAPSKAIRSGIRYGLRLSILATLAHFLPWPWQATYPNEFAFVGYLALVMFALGFVFGFLIDGKARTRILLTADSIEFRGDLMRRPKLALDTLRIVAFQPPATRTSHYWFQGPRPNDRAIIVYKDLNQIEEFRAVLSRLTGRDIPPLS